MANLNVTYGDMKDAGRRLRDTKNEIDSQLRQAKSLVDSLVNGGYVTDQSSKRFEQNYSEFNDGATKTIEGLNGMGQYLDQASDALQQTDEELAKAQNK